MNQGMKYFVMGRYEEAEEMLRLSMKEKPRSHEGLIRLDFLARTLFAQGKLGLAERAAKKLAKESSLLESRWLLGTILFRRGKLDEAEAEFRRVIEEEPNFGKGGILSRIEFHRALKAKEMEYKPEPERQKGAFFLYLQFKGYMQLRIYREAEFAIVQALELDPDQCQLHQALAELEAEKPRYCPQCGEPVHPGWRRCTACSANLSYREPNCYRICIFCGSEIDFLWSSCPFCGRDPDQTEMDLWSEEDS